MDTSVLSSIFDRLSWPETVQWLQDHQLVNIIEAYDYYRHTYLEVRVYDTKLQELLQHHWPQHQLDNQTWRL